MSCRCRRAYCDATPLDSAFLSHIDSLREEWGRPLSVTSGARCEYWNKVSGGAGDSLHLHGKAVDFSMNDEVEVQELAAIAAKLGFGGIGTGLKLIHVDDGPEDRRWVYFGK